MAASDFAAHRSRLLRTDGAGGHPQGGQPHRAGRSMSLVNAEGAADLLGTLLDIPDTQDARSRYLSNVLAGFRDFFAVQSVTLVLGRDGRWEVDATAGTTGDSADSMRSLANTLPLTQVSEAVDSGRISVDDDVCVVPLSEGPDSARQSAALVIHGAIDRTRQDMIGDAAVWMNRVLVHVEASQNYRRRIEQQNLVLEASARWQQSESDEALLKAIADTACQLLHCERASIFLWDRRRGVLVGRPALGIDGQTLEVPDNAGIVGEVLRTRKPCFWTDKSDKENRVNRNIDASLNFQTRSLLAVPMVGERDQVLGVFEVINHQHDSFADADAALLTDLAVHAAVAITSLRVKTKLAKSRDRLLKDAASSSVMIGQHATIRAVRENASKVAQSDLAVLIRGDNGTGKEVVARNIHFQSERREGPFIAVNCAALVESLLESELFGHEEGAFTDARRTRVGQFEAASGGTLFLDEIGDMSLAGQAKLLRVLEEKVIVRVGGTQTIPVDVRVIAATNQPLEDLIRNQRFREDLFFRLNVVPMNLPRLVDRGEDVLILAEHFLKQFRYEAGRVDLKLADDAKVGMLRYSWPGNVRELRNAMERACYLSTGDEISLPDLGLRGGQINSRGGSSMNRLLDAGNGELDRLTEATRDFQIRHINGVIESVGGNMTAAAEKLGLHRSNLYRKMRQLGMSTSGG
ncbi:Transcriptional regulatory protein ZraR [Crateriforma conspicua]|uniref:Transcriptional regulatory protein ZraR n=2 Tax=Planctomycetaceae TaxID=126 RepID=A0A5C6FMV0_9PLAN|nr:Transcriptional regulatory protein ZraR [Crateriforma conspicua]